MAIDYYSIKMTNAIGGVSGSNSTVQRECEVSNGASSLCSLIERPLPFSDRSAANFPTRAFTRAVERRRSWKRTASTPRSITRPVCSGATCRCADCSPISRSWNRSNFPGSPLLNRAGAAGLPAYRLTGFVHLDEGPVSLDLLQRWHSSTRRSSDPSQIFDAPDLKARAFTDVTFGYSLKAAGGQANFFFTVQNLFDQQPDPFVNTGAGQHRARLLRAGDERRRSDRPLLHRRRPVPLLNASLGKTVMIRQP